MIVSEQIQIAMRWTEEGLCETSQSGMTRKVTLVDAELPLFDI